MKKETALKDFNGRILGYIEEDEKGNKVIKNFYRKVLGRYDKATDTTRNFYGVIIGRGDLSSVLLYKNKI